MRWSRKPVIVTSAARSTERFLISAQAPASGIQVRAAACCGVSRGGSLVSETARGSISPIRICSQGQAARRTPPSENFTSTCHAVASFVESRNRKVGGVISGGKIEPRSEEHTSELQSRQY